ncbi:FAD-dependent oxidoreductase [Streptomyces albulus]|nr:FAD-dependent oxidoreductase [Streptomyces noursei]
MRPRRLQRDGRAFDRRRSRVLGHPRCTWCPETMVWALERRDPDGTGGAPPPRVHLLHGRADGSGRRRSTVDPDALVLAVGAHDRVLPFPGWELPGVFTAGAAQALAKGERVVVGDRVVVAGTGPFLLPVAAALMEAGTQVRAVLEANVPGTVVRGWSRRGGELAVHTARIRELCRYGGELVRHRVPYRFGRAVVAARGAGRVEEVVTARLRADWSVVPGSERSTAVDALCVSHGFSPQLELPLAAGCTLRGRTTASPAGEFVAVDADQRTSVAGVYAAGRSPGSPAPRPRGPRVPSRAGSPAAGTRATPPCAECDAIATRGGPSPRDWPGPTRSDRPGPGGWHRTPSSAAARRPTTPSCGAPSPTRRCRRPGG